MPAQNFPPDRQDPACIPELGTLMKDTSRDRIGEFRGLAGPHWSLRPICGGPEWEVEPEHVRPADPIERLQAQNARCNARSRGEVL
ncbi:hypothetical protein OG909_14880 [Streptomyces sp. NBC_01754]|uniref:hypothetical protein n=1 Tax=Streptomyces sp. NBC_01754 TaxID=2975930 RepID=UPI002DDAA20B|nr:hypothetical protein [Streptomyces sp. NBC_01754]WSC93465.1 hypothetical protein OG909_14880 [Streptomyces sp. NBC_01754]